MARKSDPARGRGKQVVLPEWWLESLRLRIGDESMTMLAARVSANVGRRPPWDRTTVANFLRNEHATVELMDAMCQTFPDLPRPLFVARSFEEAHELERIYDAFSERIERAQMLDIATSNVEKDARKAVGSPDGDSVSIGGGERSGERRAGRVEAGGRLARRARP